MNRQQHLLAMAHLSSHVKSLAIKYSQPGRFCQATLLSWPAQSQQLPGLLGSCASELKKKKEKRKSQSHSKPD